jgi:serine/threonine protein kinase
MLAVLGPGVIVDQRYEMLELVAEGGMGVVYRARRVHLGDEVAVKVIRAEGDRPTLHGRFLRESRLAAQLRHPNVVTILDFNIGADGWPYLVMEYLNGRSLRQEIAEGGPLDVARVQAIVPPLCAALQMAHDRGVLHRDIKPANIVGHRFDSGQMVYKIIDFGLANVRQASEETRLTDAQNFVGTMAYASPEQLRNLPLDGRADLYSLGIVIFELLTGRLPFEGGDVMSVVTGHLTAEPPRPSALRPSLPPWVDTVVARALAKRPEDRHASIAEFGEALLRGSEPGIVGAASALDRPPFLGDRYQVGRRIARGRLGSEVYAGEHRVLGHPVAIRVLRRAGRANWDAVRARFLREARTLQIVHPSILQVRDYGETDDIVYVVTDLIEGLSLRELLDRDGPIAWPRLGGLVAQLIDATVAVHRRGGLVGALSPDIVRVRAPRASVPAGDRTARAEAERGDGAPASDGAWQSTGVPATMSDEDGERLLVSCAGICEVRDLLATLDERTLRGDELVDAELRYVAPEILTGRSADVRSDVYTTGVVAYEMATGHVPFDAPSLPQLIGVLLCGVLPNPRDRQPSLPEAAAACIMRALAADPGARFGNARELAITWKASL